jgi:hypothetical protein
MKRTAWCAVVLLLGAVNGLVCQRAYAQSANDILWDRYGCIDEIRSLAVSANLPTIFVTGGTEAQTCPLQLGQWPLRAQSPDINIAASKISAGDSELMVSYGGGEIDAWNPKTNSIREIWEINDGVSGIVFIDVSSDDSLIAVLTSVDTIGGSGNLYLIDRSSGKDIWSVPNTYGMARFSPDGKLLLTSMATPIRGEAGLALIDVVSGTIIKQYSQFLNSVWGIVWDPIQPGVFAVSSGDFDTNGVQLSGIMDTSGEFLENVPMGDGGGNNFLDFSPDGAYAAAEDLGGIDLYCMSDSTSSFISANGNVFDVAFINNDTIIGADNNSVKIFSASQGAYIRTLTSFGASTLTFSGDGTKLSSSSTGLMEATTGETITYDAGGTIISYDGSTVIDIDGEGGVYICTQKLDSFVTLHSDVTDTGGPSLGAFSPSDSLFATAVAIWENDTLYSDPRNAVQLWSVNTRSIVRQFVAPNYYPVNCLAFSHDGSMLAASNPYDGTYIWNTSNGQLIDHIDTNGDDVFFLPGDTSLLIPNPFEANPIGDPYGTSPGLGIYSLSGHPTIFHSNSAINSYQFALTSDGKTCFGNGIGQMNGAWVYSGIQAIDVSSGSIIETIPVPDSGMNGCIAVNQVTGDIAVGGEDLIVYKALGTASVKEISTPSGQSLEAFTLNGSIMVRLPLLASADMSGKVFVYRSDGRCYFTSEVQPGESSVTTSVLPSGDYFIVFEPSTGERAFTKVSLLN